MSKPKHPRRLADTESQAILSNIRVSPRKLNLVAQLIRNRTAADAVATLTFSKRRIAKDVRKVLESAIANAENNHQLDVDRLIVSRAEVELVIVFRVGDRALQHLAHVLGDAALAERQRRHGIRRGAVADQLCNEI